MGDRGAANGWTTVGQANPTLNLNLNQAWDAEQEFREREIIAAWDDDHHWPGVNKPLFNGADAKRFDQRLSVLEDLGFGAFGRVEKVSHGSVCLARKRISRRRGYSIDDLRQEGLTMRKLDHRHIVKLVGTYAPRPHELCLLIWPAAVCNLSVLLDDVESLRLKDGDRTDILQRFHLLGLNDLSAIEPASTPQCLNTLAKCPLEFLRHVIGCTARAIAHCHASNVRHLDIKPSNILLMADRVYLADFGISRDVSNQDQTMTEGLPGTERWRAPELYSGHGSSMQLSDIYSLGLVYLNIATVLYNVRLADFEDALTYSPRESREEQLHTREIKLDRHLNTLVKHSLVTPPFMFTHEGQETVRPRPLTSLISRMLASSPRTRLPAAKIDEKLSMLGGIHQIYHGECCKRPISWVEDRWDRKFSAIVTLRKENAHQRKRLDELEGMDRTYEQRLRDARESMAMMQDKLKQAEERCRMLEAENEQLQRSGSRRTSATTIPKASRNSAGSGSPAIRQFLTKTRSTPNTPPARPTIQNKSYSAQQHRPYMSPAAAAASPSPRTSVLDLTPPTRSPSITNLPGSRLPRRTGTPIMNRDQSSTDSSMASSIFSQRSIETTPTPIQESPKLAWDDRTEMPASPTTAVSSPTTIPSDVASSDAGEGAVKFPPRLVPLPSWADVAKKEGRRVVGKT